MAGAGVLALATAGEFPTWALVLAVSFSFYGLLRKRAHVGPMVGITIEMGNLFPLAAAFMAFTWITDGGLSIAALPPGKLALVFLAGAITVAPLLWFNHGAKRLRLSTLGFIQFIAPTGQFLMAVLLMDAQFKGVRVATFALIWLAIIVFSVDSVRHHHGERRMARNAPGS
jgi:chloramphenicol-sensitive protein RarD